MRNVPFWYDTFPRSRRPSYPKLRGQHRTSVVIVGGGLTGCAAAASFAAAGVKVVLLEAETIAAAGTATATGLVREDFDASFQHTTSLHGRRAARLMWQAMHRASLDFAAAIRRSGIRCDLAEQDLLHVARGTRIGDDHAKALKKEYQSRRDAGLDHSWVTPAAVAREAGLQSGGAIRTRGAVVDPYRAALGLAAAARARGATIYEQSPVQRIYTRKKAVEVSTARGTVTADAVIHATGAPVADVRALARHIKRTHGYAVVTEPLPGAVRREVGRRSGAFRDSSEPPHLIRWLKDERALVAGAEQPIVADRLRAKAVAQRTGQLMYEFSVLYPAISGLQAEWGWDSVRHDTPDGLPFAGLHRNFPRHLFAFGQGNHGPAAAWLSARVLLRTFLGEPAKGDEFFGFARIL